MTFQRSIRTVLVAVAMLGLARSRIAADARAADVPTSHDRADAITDPAILDTPSPTPGTRGNHLVWRASEAAAGSKAARVPADGGVTNLPSEFKELGAEAARLGYHTILLAYRNEAPVAALPPPSGVGPTAAAPDSHAGLRDQDARMEILDGRRGIAPSSTSIGRTASRTG